MLLTLLLVAMALFTGRDLAKLAYAADNPIMIENQQPGSSGWRITLNKPNDATGQIKGYASATSVNKGELISFYITVNPAQTYSIDVYRIGWYQGFGGSLLQRIGPLSGTQQPACPVDDTHVYGSRLLNYKGFLSVGHDEYWSKEMRDAAEAVRNAGVNLAFFGANAVYWQVRFEASANGVANRVMTCYKDASIDPVQGATTTVLWRQAPINRPEQALIGVQFTSQTLNNEYVSFMPTNSSHWVYANTSFVDGDSVMGMVGYEADRQWPTYPLPNAVAISCQGYECE